MGDQFLQSYKQCFSLADMELFNVFSHDHNNLMGLSHDHNYSNILAQPAVLIQDHTTPFLDDDNKDDRKKRKAMEIVSTTPSSSAYSSPQVSEDNGISKKTNRGKKAKVKVNEIEGDVIHVRAKRGHATDSHSLAERVRRGKINERLRCLQDIVPGCYKTMGMAVMLDEIINYVQSLQNQVEFLSMKLTAATTFNDFNSDTDAILNAMQRTRTFEAAAMKIESNDVIGGNQQFCPLPLNFEPQQHQHQHQHPSYLT